MSVNAGQAVAYLTLDRTNFKSGLNSAVQDLKAFGDNTRTATERVKSLSSGLSGVGNTLNKNLTLPIAGAGAVMFKLASDVNESMNKVEVAFGSSADSVKAFAKTTLETYGMAEGSALDMAALFGDMATSMKIPQAEAAKMSTSLVGLAGDMASFKNISVDRAQTALAGIYTGETESLKALGIVMTEVNLQEYASSQGIKKKIKDMTQAEKVQLRYNYVMSVSANSIGDFARTGDSAANQVRMFQEGLKELGATLGQTLLPIITPMIKQLNEWLLKFKEMNPETQEMIVKCALLAATMGPLLSISGKLLSASTSLVGIGGKVIGGLGKLTGLFSSGTVGAGTFAKGVAGVGKESAKAIPAVAGAAGSISKLGLLTKAGALLFNPWTLGIAAAGAGAVILGKKLSEEVVPKVDLFEKSITKASDGTVTGSVKISEATKKAVGAYVELDEKATQSLMNLRFSGEAITADIADNLKSQFDNMSNTIISELDKDYQAGLASLQSMFTTSSTMTAEEQQKALEQLNSHFTNQKNTTTESTAQINEILRIAAAENRTTTIEENAEIDRLKNEMRVNAINCLSETELESKVITDRMAAYDGRVTAEVALEHVRLLDDQRIKAIDSANREYQERIAVAEAIRRDGGAEAEVTATKIIDEATRQRDETIIKANETKEQGIDKLSLSYTDLRKEIDTDSIEILSWWGKLKGWWDTNNFAKKTITAEFVEENKKVQTTRNQYGGTSQGYATGTNSALSGLKRVGEYGPELINFKGGETVYNAAETRRIVNSMDNGVSAEVINSNNLESIIKTMADVVAISVAEAMEKLDEAKIINIPISLDKKVLIDAVYPGISNNLALSRKGRR